MSRKLMTAALALALALIGAQTLVFAEQPAAPEQAATPAAPTAPAAQAPANKDDQSEAAKVQVVVQGEKGPEIKEMAVMRDTAKKTRKLYATANFPHELGLDKRPPVLLRQLGLLVDQAVESNDVAGLVGLSFSLAAFEKQAGKQAASLKSGDLLELAGKTAVAAKDKTGMTLVAGAYRDAAFGLADKDRADEFAQLAETTRDQLSNFDSPRGLDGIPGVVWAALAKKIREKAAQELGVNTAVLVINDTGSSVSVYVDRTTLGSVSSEALFPFAIQSCGGDLVFTARDGEGEVVAGPRRRFVGCGEWLVWYLD